MYGDTDLRTWDFELYFLCRISLSSVDFGLCSVLEVNKVHLSGRIGLLRKSTYIIILIITYILIIYTPNTYLYPITTLVP